MQKLDPALKEAISLAEAAGWSVEISGNKARFQPPDARPPIIVSSYYQNDRRKRLLTNMRNEAQRAQRRQAEETVAALNGAATETDIDIVVERKETAVTDQKTAPTPLDIKSVAEALDTCVQMVEELAEQFRQYRNYISDEALPPLRGQVHSIEQALKDIAKGWDGALGALRSDLQSLSAKVSNLEAKAQAEPVDPIAAFRERLRR